VSPRFRLEGLNKSHDRLSFDCGEEVLNRYFQARATQDSRRRIANCFVAIDSESGHVAGYYTLSSASIPTLDLPEDITSRLPRYPSIPAVRIGRLAVDKRFQRQDLGKALLADAAIKSISATPASFALIVDAKNEQAVKFYQHYGFRPLNNTLIILYLPMATAEKCLI
jgi:ribosomal protein S18 acetylase RimI-like enzyme